MNLIVIGGKYFCLDLCYKVLYRALMPLVRNYKDKRSPPVAT
ncbi:hypothetical protein [Acidaminococcus sp.]